MSAVDQAPAIRLWHVRPRWHHLGMVAALMLWGAVLAAAVVLAPLHLIPAAALGDWVYWVLGIGALLVGEAGAIWIVGYHRARGVFPAVVWHFSAEPWTVGQEISLDPEHCKLGGRMVRGIRIPRRATYVFDRRPRRADVAANRGGRGTLYELQVIEAPSAHYRRWDGSGAVGSLEPIRVRVVRADDTRAIR